MKKLFVVVVCLALIVCLAACDQEVPASEDLRGTAQGGVLVLQVNPEIAVEYDENGTVTGVTARNDDALAIIDNRTDLIGQPAEDVVLDLVTAIGEAGYFLEEIEGKTRYITLELEPGSALPDTAFLENIAELVRKEVNEQHWTIPINPNAESLGSTDCTKPNCDDRIYTNPNCKDPDCDDLDCDDGTCTNPNCKDLGCDEWNCDAGVYDNQHSKDNESHHRKCN